MKLSIVVPVYYNANNLPVTYQALKNAVLMGLDDYELIIVDDGSADNSYEVMQTLRRQDSKIKLVKLARNFGSITAQLAGLNYASGDCVTVIAADLQEPPQIILQLFQAWQSGAKVALAVRSDRQESWLQKTISNMFYKIMRKIALPNMPAGGFDCFLIDRKVVDIIKNIEEKNSSIVGQILWTGFKPHIVHYVRQKREIGQSRWTLTKKIKYFIDSILAFSYVPIRAMSTVGLLCAVLSVIGALIIITEKIFMHVPVRGWSSLVCIILFTFGIQTLLIGIVGEYLWRALDEIRKRPNFIVEQTEGLE